MAQQGTLGLHAGPGKAGCNKCVMPLCDVTRVTTVIRNQAAATGFTLAFNLTRCNFFQALGARMNALDTATPTILREAEVQAIDINGCAEEAGSNNAVAIGNTTMVGLLSDYRLPDSCFCPVSWGIFAQDAFVENLEFGLFNIDVAAIDVYVSLAGNCLTACPPGLTLGQPFMSGF